MATKKAAWETAAKKAGPVKKSAVVKEAISNTRNAVTDRLAAKANQAAKTNQAIAASAPPREYSPGFKKPKTLAQAADLLYDKRRERLAEQKTVEAIEVIEKDLKAYLIEELPKQSMSTVGGKTAKVTLKKKEIAKANNWSEVYAGIVKEYLYHVKKKDGQEDSAFAILSRAIADSTVQEIWQEGKVVPGVVPFPVTSLSIEKV